MLDSLRDEIELSLMSHLPNSKIEVHSNDDRHFSVLIISNAFMGKSRIQQHKLIYNILDPFMESSGGRLHALALQTKISE